MEKERKLLGVTGWRDFLGDPPAHLSNTPEDDSDKDFVQERFTPKGKEHWEKLMAGLDKGDPESCAEAKGLLLHASPLMFMLGTLQPNQHAVVQRHSECMDREDHKGKTGVHWEIAVYQESESNPTEAIRRLQEILARIHQSKKPETLH